MLAAAGGPDVHPHAMSEVKDRERWDRDVARFPEDFGKLDAFFRDVLAGKLSEDEAAKVASTFYGEQGPWYTVGWKMTSIIEKTLGRDRLIACTCDRRKLPATYNEAVRKLGGSLPMWSEEVVRAFEQREDAVTLPPRADAGPMEEDLGQLPERLKKRPELLGQMPERFGQIAQALNPSPERFGQTSWSLGQTPERLGQTPQPLGQTPEPLGQTPQLLGLIPERLGQAPERLGQRPEPFGQTPECQRQMPQLLGHIPERLEQTPQRLGQTPQRLGQTPESPGQAPEPNPHRYAMSSAGGGTVG